MNNTTFDKLISLMAYDAPLTERTDDFYLRAKTTGSLTLQDLAREYAARSNRDADEVYAILNGVEQVKAGARPGLVTDKAYTLNLPTGGLKAGHLVTATDLEGFTVIPCPTPGSLATAWPTSNPTKVLVTGTLNAADMETLNSHKNEITHLYATARAEKDEDWASINFSLSSSLQEVYLAQAKNIGTLAFYLCKALQSVNLPLATTIRDFAFHYCEALQSVNLPQAENIGDNAFAICTTLTSICLPKSVIFGRDVFNLYSALTTLYLSDCEEADFNEATYSNYGGVSWLTIYYGYHGTDDGNYLDPANYLYSWLRYP